MPPVAASEAEYATETCPLGKEDVLMTKGGAAATVRVSDLVAFCCVELESVTCTVIEKLPEAVGVPEITPDEAIVKPAGSEPEVMDHE